MEIVNKTTIGIAAGVCGTLFLGYCLYFDQQRRKDPDFKKKLRERRRAKQQSSRSQKSSGMPDLSDHEAVQRFFLQEVQLGEELLASGDLESGVEHLGNAVAVCGQPNQLLQVLQQTLPPHVFHMLLQRLPQAGNRIAKAGPQVVMQEEDVE